MARFQITLMRRSTPADGQPQRPAAVRILAALAFGTLAAVLVVLVFVLGYLVLGLVAAAMLLAVLAALIKATLRSLRR
jgi:hypothetical protein